VFEFEAHLVYNKIKLSLWPYIQANILLLYYMTSFWISCSFFCIYFVCTCFFADKYLCDVFYLEKLIHMRDDTRLFGILFFLHFVRTC
jgi:hypothetical protein